MTDTLYRFLDDAEGNSRRGVVIVSELLPQRFTGSKFYEGAERSVERLRETIAELEFVATCLEKIRDEIRR